MVTNYYLTRIWQPTLPRCRRIHCSKPTCWSDINISDNMGKMLCYSRSWLIMSVIHNCLDMANAPKVTLSRKLSPATGIFTKSISRTVATKASQSPVSNVAEKESFNCCISRSRYLKSLPLSNWEKALIVLITKWTIIQYITLFKLLFLDELAFNCVILCNFASCG